MTDRKWIYSFVLIPHRFMLTESLEAPVSLGDCLAFV